MHLEFLVEDSSGKALLDILIPKILGEHGELHTWRVKPYKGVGRLPKGLNASSDPRGRILLDQLPRLLQGYGKTPGIDAVVVVVDTDKRDCRAFLGELKTLLSLCDPAPNTLFRLAIEEIEAWYLGDREALLEAYPTARKQVLADYRQDSVCGTWELLADALVKGGAKEVKKTGWPAPGELKHEWAGRIGPRMVVWKNQSPSFRKFNDGLRRLVAAASTEKK